MIHIVPIKIPTHCPSLFALKSKVMKISMLEKAIQIATEAHKGQKDKGEHDYIGHPLRVMNCVTHETDKIVAVLHDVVEDTDIMLVDLRISLLKKTTDKYLELMIGEVEYKNEVKKADEVIEGVRCMTRSEGQTWKSYIEGVMGSKIAVRVKIADLRDNLDLTRLRSLKDLNINSLNMYITTYHKLIKHERENK